MDHELLRPCSERLCFEPLTDAAIEATLPFFSDVSRFPYYLTGAPQQPFTLERLKTFLASWNEDGAMAFALSLKEDKRVIGIVSFEDIDHHSQCAEFGIAITDASALRKGYAKEGGALAISYAFGELNLRRLMARYMGPNHASQRLLTGLGFKEEGILHAFQRRGNAFLDLHILALFRKEPT